MIKYTVKLSAQAEKDLETIFKNFRGTKPVALAELETHIKGLENLPERYPFYEEEPWISKGVRFMKTSCFGVFFGFNKETKVVYVARVLVIM
ncbi:MAG: type II toxin-antitoxin system RelE/ParE family toxin [Treponema sp.]|nr:type II toxin-antitoxin system RelE/ParE family toxin [Treponema sp.]